MAKRKPTAIVDVGLRMRESMRLSLQKSAKRAGISMNAEIVSRIDQTLYDDQRLSGERVKRLTDMIAMTFSVRGTIGMRAPEHWGKAAKWIDDAWVDDPTIYFAAAAEVVALLVDAGPGDSFEARRHALEAAVTRSLNRRLAPELPDRPSKKARRSKALLPDDGEPQ